MRKLKIKIKIAGSYDSLTQENVSGSSAITTKDASGRSGSITIKGRSGRGGGVIVTLDEQAVKNGVTITRMGKGRITINGMGNVVGALSDTGLDSSSSDSPPNRGKKLKIMLLEN